MNTGDIMRIGLKLSGMHKVPFDSAIFCPADNVHRILLGIDISESDLRQAEAEGYDLAIAHHPFNQTAFIRMMSRHEELMLDAGVSLGLAIEACRQNRVPYENWASSLPPDETSPQLTALARELGLGLMNIHNPCDEIGRLMFQKVIDDFATTETVSDLMERFRAIPEVAASGEEVELVCGLPHARRGKTIMIHAAGTNGGYHVANTLFESGVDTVVYIHLNSPKQRLRLQEENKGNLILTGHYGSDSLGINPLIDELETEGVEVDCCNKMIRIRRERIEQIRGSNALPRMAHD